MALAPEDQARATIAKLLIDGGWAVQDMAFDPLVPLDPNDEPASALLARLVARPAETPRTVRGRARKLLA